MAQFTPMHLLKRNFNTDPLNRNVTACVSAITTFVNNETFEVQQNISYFNTSHCSWFSFWKNFTAPMSRGNGTVRNTFLSTDKSSSNDTLVYPVIFAGEDCLITRLTHRSNDTYKACELWVRDSYFERNTSFHTCCDFIFDFFCSPATQVLYNRTQCEELRNDNFGMININ